jgi:hypothetical protein
VDPEPLSICNNMSQSSEFSRPLLIYDDKSHSYIRLPRPLQLHPKEDTYSSMNYSEEAIEAKKQFSLYIMIQLKCFG